jgi:hypothetical protein
MNQCLTFVLLSFFLVHQGQASDACPVTLVSGKGNPHVITITFKNTDKRPIRRLDFTCKAVDVKRDNVSRWHCYETDASFMPEAESTVSYQLSGHIPGPVLVSVKSITFSDGSTWKPPKHDSCQVLKIRVPQSD